MTKKKYNTYKAYVCSKDGLYHFPDDWNGVNIYFSEESLREHRSCVKDGKYGCKVCEIVVKVPVDIIDGD